MPKIIFVLKDSKPEEIKGIKGGFFIGQIFLLYREIIYWGVIFILLGEKLYTFSLDFLSYQSRHRIFFQGAADISGMVLEGLDQILIQPANP